MPKSVFTETYRQFVKMLVQARLDAKLTQAELAERIGWQQTDISKVERGERRLDVVEFLEFADALTSDPADLIRRLSQLRKR